MVFILSFFFLQIYFLFYVFWIVSVIKLEKPIAVAAELFQLCPTLCNPTDESLPGSPVPGILQAKTLEWGAISFPNAWKWKVKVKSVMSNS